MSFKLALAQISATLGDLDANVDRHQRAIDAAAQAGANLVVFPELSLSGYLLKDLTADIAIDPRSSKHLRAVAEHRPDVSLLVGFAEISRDFKFYNSCAFVEGGKVQHVHRKVYLPTYGMFDEERFFAKGDTLRTFDSALGRLGALICEDLWHFSTSYLLAQQGALMILASIAGPARGIRTNSSGLLGSAESWELLARSIAQFNTVYVVYANRVGFEDGANFFGGSLVVDPFGHEVVRAKYFEEDVRVAEMDFDLVRRARTQVPLLRDERIELTLRELDRVRRQKFQLE